MENWRMPLLILKRLKKQEDDFSEMITTIDSERRVNHMMI